MDKPEFTSVVDAKGAVIGSHSTIPATYFPDGIARTAAFGHHKHLIGFTRSPEAAALKIAEYRQAWDSWAKVPFVADKDSRAL